MTDDIKDMTLAYKCKICGRLYQYNVNEDKVHITLDYVLIIAAIIFMLCIIFRLTYSIIT